MIYDRLQREEISRTASGQTIESLEWVDYDGWGYWVMTFGDGTEISFRLMAEIMG